jgi:hypothetical protein
MLISAAWYKQVEPWKKEQLITASELMSVLNDNKKDKPVIYNIGYVNDIPGAIRIGSIKEPENLDNFEKELNKLNKNQDIVIYCGCCPFKDCPNIRPAFKYISEHGFTNHKLLDLPQNIKSDWIDKGYPLKTN